MFALEIAPNGGPGFLFVTLHGVFMSMGSFVGPLFGFLFYFLVLLAAINSAISLLEVCTSYIVDRNLLSGRPADRKKWASIMGVIIFIIGLPIALDGLGMNPIMHSGDYLPFGWCFLDVYDLISEGFFMPLGALCMTIIIGWVMKDKFGEEVRLEGNTFGSEKFVMLCAKYITPIAMIFVLVTALLAPFGVFS